MNAPYSAPSMIVAYRYPCETLRSFMMCATTSLRMPQEKASTSRKTGHLETSLGLIYNIPSPPPKFGEQF